MHVPGTCCEWRPSKCAPWRPGLATSCWLPTSRRFPRTLCWWVLRVLRTCCFFAEDCKRGHASSLCATVCLFRKRETGGGRGLGRVTEWWVPSILCVAVEVEGDGEGGVERCARGGMGERVRCPEEPHDRLGLCLGGGRGSTVVLQTSHS